LGLLTARLTNLRDLTAIRTRIYVDKPTAPFAKLTQLCFDNTEFVDGNGNDCDLDLLQSLFSPAQLPALRQMHIDDRALGEDPTRFNLVLPQLSDIEFNCIPSLVAGRLPHCTSLKRLRLRPRWDEQRSDLLPFINSLRSLNLEGFHYWVGPREDWESSLRDVRRIMVIVGEMKNLKNLSTLIVGINDDNEGGEKWREFKEEVRKICQKNKVQMMRYHDNNKIFARDELTWVD
jgi:hypothetical protein